MTANLVAARGQAAGAAARGAARAATVAVDLCIEVAALQPSSALGQPAQWSVTAWATGGSVANAAIALQVSPASAGTAEFSLGCGSGNGTSTCNLGTVDAGSAQLQFQAQLAIPLTATVTTVSLTATGSATGLVADPAASAPVAVIAPAAPTLPAGVTLPGATVSPTGSAASPFPTLNPSAPSASIAGGTRQVDNTSALPTGNNHVGVELVGLFALAVAFVLAITRVSVRRPVGRGKGGANGTAPRGQSGANGTAPLPPAAGGPPPEGTGGTE